MLTRLLGLPQAASPALKRKLWVVGLLYYAEGLPYGFLFKSLTYYLSTQGLSLAAIGLAGLLHLPWVLKFLWAPLADRYGRRSAWIIGCHFCLIPAIIIMPHLAIGSHWFFMLLALVALAGASQDIAIDAYSIDILEPQEQGPANGVRLSTYRLALIASGGLVVWLSDLLGWAGAFLIMASSLAAVTAVIILWPPAHEPRRCRTAATASLGSVIREAWGGLLKLPYLWAVVLFILLFKAGESFLGQMVGPFWHRSGFSATEFGVVSGTIGTLLSIIGSLWGGGLVTRWGLSKSLWILGGLQAVSNLGYAVAALLPGVAPAIYGASMAESLCGGLGNAPFITFMMRLCSREVSAAQYAALSAVFGLSGTAASSLSGFAAQSLGYAVFFGASFVVALPAFIFLPWAIKALEQRQDGYAVR